jgi:hypothetical protein
MGLGGARRG